MLVHCAIIIFPDHITNLRIASVRKSITRISVDPYIHTYVDVYRWMSLKFFSTHLHVRIRKTDKFDLYILRSAFTQPVEICICIKKERIFISLQKKVGLVTNMKTSYSINKFYKNIYHIKVLI